MFGTCVPIPGTCACLTVARPLAKHKKNINCNRNCAIYYIWNPHLRACAMLNLAYFWKRCALLKAQPRLLKWSTTFLLSFIPNKKKCSLKSLQQVGVYLDICWCIVKTSLGHSTELEIKSTWMCIYLLFKLLNCYLFSTSSSPSTYYTNRNIHLTLSS